MSKKHIITLEKIFERPTRADITWREVENLFKAVGSEVKEGRGSRMRITKNNAILRLHKPHPQKEVKKYAVEEIRKFLALIKCTPGKA